MMRTWVSLALATTLCGCVSSLNVQRYDPAGPPRVGYPYRLRFTQYQVTATWRVVSCDAAAATPLKIKTSAEIKETTALDPDQFYVIDPRSLQGLFRTTEFTMEWYEDRTPKTITSDVDDQSAAAIGNVIEGAVKLASAGLGLPAGPASNKCTKAVTDALEGINGKLGDPRHPGQKAATDTAQKAVDDQTTTLTTLNAAAAAMGATIDGGTRRTLGQARTRLQSLLAVLAVEQDRLKELNDVLTDTKTISWPETGSKFDTHSDPLKPSAGARKRWNLDDSKSVMIFMRLTPLDGTTIAAADPSPEPVAPVPFPVPAPTPAPVATPPVGGWPAAGGGQKPPPVAANPPAADGAGAKNPASHRPAAALTVRVASRAVPSRIPGLPYREPGPVRLDVCLGDPCSGSIESLDDSGGLVASNTGLALQAGTMLYLPFRAQTFAHIKNSAGFAQSGVLTSAGTSQLRGAGSAVTEAFKSAAGTVGTFVDAQRGVETKRLTAAADEAKARKALADAEAALAPNPSADDLAKIAAFQTEASLATAEKTRNDALAALAASRAAAGQ